MKRFRDTNLGRDSWFRKLTPTNKCIWNFLCDECDSAGVWSIDQDSLEFHIGETIDLQKFIEAANVGKIRIEMFGEDKIFINGFVQFQYGDLSEKCVPHQKIISLLKKYNLLDRVCGRVSDRVLCTHKEEEEYKEEDKDKEERGSGGKQKSQKQTNIHASRVDDQKDLKAEYKGIIETVQQMQDNRDQKKAIADFIESKKPQFIDPYADLWNLSIRQHGISQVNGLSEGRQRKFNTRIKDQLFDFIKILTEIHKSDYLKGKTTDWRVDWDWIFENDTNYLKIIEGKYRNS